MFRRAFIAMAAAAGVCLGLPAAAAAENGYAPVNGLEMDYDGHGAGRPLVLLHGALMT